MATTGQDTGGAVYLRAGLETTDVAAGVNEIKQQLGTLPASAEQSAQRVSKSFDGPAISAGTMAQKIAKAAREVGDSVDAMSLSGGRTEKQLTRYFQTIEQQAKRAFVSLKTEAMSASDALAFKITNAGGTKEYADQVVASLKRVEAERTYQLDSARAQARAMSELQALQAQQAKESADREIAARKAVTSTIEQSYQAAKAAMAVTPAAAVTNTGSAAPDTDASTKRMVANANELADSHVRAFQAMKAGKAATGELVEGTKAYNAALRQVPAQMTDIVVSLQGGQAPLTVLLQQGGQLKDVFGSASGAARALGAEVLKVVTNPYALLIGSLGALAYAYYKGSKETDAYNKAIIDTGNISGVTAGQLQGMAKHMSEFGVTQGAAAEALALFVANGQQGSVALEQFALTAVKYSKASGAAVGDVVKNFSDLAKDPVKASARLNESMNYLTATTYSQIKALEEVGKHYEAGALAQNAMADALNKRKGDYEAHLGYLERMWRATKGLAADTGDWILNIGRPKTTEGSISDLTKQKAEWQKVLDAPVGFNTNFAERGFAKQQIEAIDSQLVGLNKVALKKSDIAALDAQSAQAEKDAIAWTDRVTASLSNQEKRKKELAEIDNLAALTSSSGKAATPAEIAYQKAIVNAKYDTGASVAAVKIAEDQKLQIIARAQSQIDLLRATGQTTEIGLVAEANKLEIAAIDARIEANRKEAAIVASKPNTERELVSLNQQLAQLEEDRTTAAVKGSNAIVAARYAEWKIIKDQVQALSDEAKMIDLESQNWARSDSERARLAANLQIEVNLEKELKRIKESGQSTPDISAQSEVAKANALLAQQQAFDKARNSYFIGANKEAIAFADSMKAINAEIDLGVKLVGESAQVQQIENEKLKITLDLEKKIRDLKARGDLNPADKIAEESRLRREAADQEIAAINKITLDYWKSTVESIQTDLTDAIITGVKNGAQAGAISLRDSFVKAFENLVLRPQINAIVNPLAQGIAGALGVSPGGAAGSNFLTSAAGSAFGKSIGLGAGGYLAQFGSGFSGSATAASAMMGGAPLTTAASIGAGAAAIAPYVTAALVIKGLTDYSVSSDGNFLVANASSKGVGRVDTRADFTQSSSGIFSGGTTHNSSWGNAGAGVTGFMDTLVRDTTVSVKGYAKALGLVPDAVDGFTKQIEINISGLNPEQQAAAISKAVGSFTDEMVSSAYGNALSAFSKQGETSSQTIQRLAVDLTTVNDAFKYMGKSLLDVSLSGASAADSLVTLMGGLDNFKTQTASYYSNFYSPSEQRAGTVKQINTALAGTGFDAATASREDFRKLVDAQDLTTESGRKTYAALMSVAGAFASITPTIDSVAAATKEAAQKMQAAIASVRTNLAESRFGLENQLLSLEGNDGEVARRIREHELKKLTAGITDQAAIDQITADYDYNEGLKKEIKLKQDAKMASEAAAQAQKQAADEAARAAEQIRSAWQSVTDGLFGEVSRIRDLMGGGSLQSYAQAQAKFGIATAQARAGDQDAAKLLPELSKTLLALAESQATSLQELRRIQGQTAASLELTGNSLVSQYGLSLPKFDVGTNFVPFDMAAIVHRGEAIVPAAYNPANGFGAGQAGGSDAGQAAMAQAMQSMAAQLAVMRTQLDAANRELVRIGNGTNGRPENTPEIVVVPA